jgi:cell division protein ZapA (FtsZ GTPase activity inhibitor)
MPTEYAKPEGGFKLLPSIDKLYTETLKLVYPTARDIAKELEEASSKFATGARERIEELVAVVQRLKWEVKTLKEQAEEARKGTVEAVMTMHELLKPDGDLGDLREYLKERETTEKEIPDNMPTYFDIIDPTEVTPEENPGKLPE